MKAASGQVVRITRHFDFPPERVFDAWLDPHTAGRWLFTDEKGTITRCEIDARVGGKFLIVDRRPVGDVDHIGEYLQIDRPRRLVFTFAVPRYSPLETRVTLDIVPSGKGCDLTLTHENVLPEWTEQTQQGWGMILDALEESLHLYAELTNPDTLRFERLLPGPIERVWAYLTESDKRAQWLASGVMEPRVGACAVLHFDHSTLSKEVAAPPERFKNKGCGDTPRSVTVWNPPHILALTWGNADEPSEVTFELTPQQDKVLLVLTHRRLVNRDTRLGVAAGWHAHLNILKDRLDGREPEAFWKTFGALDADYAKRLP
jgi:uncharacterized protein YndB with AHSA1/START domain